ncbi:MAG: hypothetical protein IJA89_07465 [Clostridia bacterium]|nr:hypothetical protein [Clostridia bacterium]
MTLINGRTGRRATSRQVDGRINGRAMGKRTHGQTDDERRRTGARVSDRISRMFSCS